MSRLLTPKVAELASEGPLEIAQDDTFFNCVNGRLKLRAFSNDAGELIFYRRVNQAGPKESFYIRSPTSSPETLRESLSLAYGQIGRIRKYRTLFLVGRTRVHLDRVEGLGHFLELEVMLVDDEPAEQGIREASELMDQLGVQPEQLIEGAYLDLMLAQGEGAVPAFRHRTGEKNMKAPILALTVAAAAFASSSLYLWSQLRAERDRVAQVEETTRQLNLRIAELEKARPQVVGHRAANAGGVVAGQFGQGVVPEVIPATSPQPDAAEMNHWRFDPPKLPAAVEKTMRSQVRANNRQQYAAFLEEIGLGKECRTS